MGVAAIEARGGDGITARWDVGETVVAGSISRGGSHRGSATGDRHRGSRQRDWSGTVDDWTCQHRAADAQARNREGHRHRTDVANRGARVISRRNGNRTGIAAWRQGCCRGIDPERAGASGGNQGQPRAIGGSLPGDWTSAGAALAERDRERGGGCLSLSQRDRQGGWRRRHEHARWEHRQGHCERLGASLHHDIAGVTG